MPLWLFPGGSVVKNQPVKQEMWVQSLGQEDTLEMEMTTHSNILAWEIPWTEEPAGLQSMVLQVVGHHLATEQQPRNGFFQGLNLLWCLIIEGEA